MVVYIEYIIIINIAVNAFLIRLACAVLRKKIRPAALFLSAAVGTAAAVLLPYIRILIFMYKLCSVLLITAVIERSSWKSYFKMLFTFVVLTFLTGGIISGLYNFIDGSLVGGGFIGGKAAFFTAAGATAAYVVTGLSVRYLNKKNSAGFYYKCRLYVESNDYELTGYYDSGNRLYSGGAPVTVISGDIAERILSMHSLAAAALQAETVGGKSEMTCFTADKLVINIADKAYTFTDVTLAVSHTVFKGYQLLLHRDIVVMGG